MPSAKEAIRRVNEAADALADAQAELAIASSTHRLVELPHPAYAVLAARRAALLAMPGVVGVGLGLRWRRGAPVDEPVVTVFVRKKRDLPASERLPPRIAAGHQAIGVDVIEIGEVRSVPELAGAGVKSEGGASGTRPGDGVGRVDKPLLRGTLGAYAHLPTGEAVALTAMHVCHETREVHAGDPPIPIGSPAFAGDPSPPPLGAADLGRRTEVDAARIRLGPGVTASTFVPTVGDIKGWRWPAYPADIGRGVCLVGVKSRRLDGVITHIAVDFPAFSLTDTIIASIPTREGDSGAALLHSPVPGSAVVLGFLVGTSSNLDSSLRIFSPAGLVLKHLGCNIP